MAEGEAEEVFPPAPVLQLCLNPDLQEPSSTAELRS